MVPNATDHAGGTHDSLLETARKPAWRASDSSNLAYDRLARSLQQSAAPTRAEVANTDVRSGLIELTEVGPTSRS